MTFIGLMSGSVDVIRVFDFNLFWNVYEHNQALLVINTFFINHKYIHLLSWSR